jgi:hypothetical protein
MGRERRGRRTSTATTMGWITIKMMREMTTARMTIGTRRAAPSTAGGTPPDYDYDYDYDGNSSRRVGI